MSLLLTVPEVAELLRKSETFVRRELTRKNLRGHKFGGEWRISEVAVDVYIEAHSNVPAVKGRAS